MNKDIKALYVAIENNEVVCFDTNLSKFHLHFSNMEPQCPSYIIFHRAFKKGYKFTKTLSGKGYHFQKVL